MAKPELIGKLTDGPIKAGEAILISSGDHDDYSVYGVIRFLKDFSEEDIVTVQNALYPDWSKLDWRDRDPSAVALIRYLVNNGIAEIMPIAHEFNLSDLTIYIQDERGEDCWTKLPPLPTPKPVEVDKFADLFADPEPVRRFTFNVYANADSIWVADKNLLTPASSVVVQKAFTWLGDVYLPQLRSPMQGGPGTSFVFKDGVATASLPGWKDLPGVPTALPFIEDQFEKAAMRVLSVFAEKADPIAVKYRGCAAESRTLANIQEELNTQLNTLVTPEYPYGLASYFAKELDLFIYEA